MDALTIIRKLFARIALLLGILVVFTLVINLPWFDEDLHPEIVPLLSPQPVSMEGNAWPLIYGFTAASERDPEEAGLAIVAQLRERFAAGEPATLAADEMANTLGAAPVDQDWREAWPSYSCNARSELDCADRLVADAGRAGHVHPRLAVLLDRYGDIVAASRFRENEEFDATTPLPDYAQLMLVARIRLALSYRDASIEQFVDVAAEDVEFWKLMLRDGQSLVAKMVALAGLRNDTTFLSTLVRRRQLAPEQLDAVTRILTPLTEAERDIGETFLAEMRIALLSSKDLAVLTEGPSPVVELALQEQATLNEYYLNTTIPLRLRASLSAADFYRQHGYESLSYTVRSFPPPLYNLGGKLVLRWMASEMNVENYISRVHDLDGRIALVLLQAEIARQADRPIEDIVRSSVYRNPYTRDPMDYDRSAGTIGFHCLANESDVCAVLLRSH